MPQVKSDVAFRGAKRTIGKVARISGLAAAMLKASAASEVQSNAAAVTPVANQSEDGTVRVFENCLWRITISRPENENLRSSNNSIV